MSQRYTGQQVGQNGKPGQIWKNNSQIWNNYKLISFKNNANSCSKRENPKLKNKKSYKASKVSSGESEPEELAAADREAMAIVEPSRCLFQIWKI